LVAPRTIAVCGQRLRAGVEALHDSGALQHTAIGRRYTVQYLHGHRRSMNMRPYLKTSGDFLSWFFDNAKHLCDIYSKIRNPQLKPVPQVAMAVAAEQFHHEHITSQAGIATSSTELCARFNRPRSVAIASELGAAIRIPPARQLGSLIVTFCCRLPARATWITRQRFTHAAVLRILRGRRCILEYS
jgi:hypothetical protein